MLEVEVVVVLDRVQKEGNVNAHSILRSAPSSIDSVVKASRDGRGS